MNVSPKLLYYLKVAGTLLGLAVLLILALPLLAVVVLAARVVIVVAVVLGLVALAASPAFRGWLRSSLEVESIYKGLRLAPGLELHPHHTWVRLEPNGQVAMGVDDIVQRTLGPVESVELPAVSRHIDEDESCLRLSRGNRSVSVRSPVRGTVTETNPELTTHPALINESPYQRGWAIRIRPSDARRTRSRLRSGYAARAWFETEIDRLLAGFEPQAQPSPALQDGGNLVSDFHRLLDDTAWRRLKASFFGDVE